MRRNVGWARATSPLDSRTIELRHDDERPDVSRSADPPQPDPEPTAASPTTPRWFRDASSEPLDADRIRLAKRAFTTRRVPVDAMRRIVSGPVRPRSGDLALARVQRLGQHTKLELTTGRRAQLHVGDEVIVAFGDRYAPDQFEAEIPRKLGTTDLVAAGGIAADVISQSASIRRATRLQVVGLVGGQSDQPLNLADFALPPIPPPESQPRTIAVVGASMNSGKTTSARYLLHGLARAGRRPGSAKVTGTGAGGDYWIMLDAGSHLSLDFTDVGLASTYRVPVDLIESGMTQLIAHLTDAGCTDIILEVADGLFQCETAHLVAGDLFRKTVYGVVFAAGDAMSALAATTRFRELDVPLVTVSGVLTRSPLAMREARELCGVPVVDRHALVDEYVASAIMAANRPGLEAALKRMQLEDEAAEWLDADASPG